MESLQSLQDRFRHAWLANVMAHNRATAQLYPEVGATHEALAGGYAFFNGVNDPGTRAAGIGYTGTLTEEQLCGLESFFQERGARISIVISDQAAAPYLPTLFSKRNYQRVASVGTWWRSLDMPVVYLTPHDLMVARVPPGDHAGEWARTAAAGYQEKDTPIAETNLDPFLVRHYRARAHVEDCHPFLAMRAGEPAGAAALEVIADVALLRAASVRVAHRGKGIQKALIAERLKMAAAAGCDVAFSTAETDGPSERNLRSFGFKLLCEGYVVSRSL